MARLIVEIGEDEWQVHTTRLYGLYGDCCYDSRTIRIHSGSRGLSLLDTTIHEVIHAQHPDMPEEDVERRATELATVLWKLGWRKPPKTTNRDKGH